MNRAHLEALPVGKHEGGGGGARGAAAHVVDKAKGSLSGQVGMHAKEVAALPELFPHNPRPPLPQHRIHACSAF